MEASTMEDLKFMYHCDLCQKEFQFGPHKYDGKFISRYQMTVCGGCYKNNWDGWGPAVEGAFLAHLKSKGIPPPKRNQGGWFPRD